MEFPFNHGHSNVTHHHHHRRDDEEESLNYPPPPNTFPHQPPPPPQPHIHGVYPPPPPPPHERETQVFHSSHVAYGHVSSDPPPPPPPSHHPVQHERSFDYGYSSAHPSPAPPAYTPPPPIASVHHISHETHNPQHTHFPSFVHHVGHHGGVSLAFNNKPTVKVVTKAGSNYSLTIRHGKVILAPSDPRDEYQHWYKDEKYSTRVKDEEGCPAFALINKVTGEAIKHSIGATHPVRLIPYNPDYLDESVLWSESKDLGDGYRAIRMVNNIRLNVDAYHGDKKSGGVHDGTTIVLWEWNKGDNQRWKILSY